MNLFSHIVGTFCRFSRTYGGTCGRTPRTFCSSLPSLPSIPIFRGNTKRSMRHPLRRSPRQTQFTLPPLFLRESRVHPVVWRVLAEGQNFIALLRRARVFYPFIRALWPSESFGLLASLSRNGNGRRGKPILKNQEQSFHSVFERQIVRSLRPACSEEESFPLELKMRSLLLRVCPFLAPINRRCPF